MADFNVGRLYETLVRDLLEQRFVEVEFSERVRIDTGIGGFRFQVDLVGRRSDGTLIVVEIKAYRSLEVPTSWLLRAIETLKRIDMSAIDETAILIRRLLVISARASQEQKRRLLESNIDVIDFDGLYELAGTDVELLSRLDASIGSLVEASSGDARPSAEIIDVNGRQKSVRVRSVQPSKTPGADLCVALRAVPVGKKGAGAFETAVQTCLEHLFSDQLTAWTKQRVLDNGLRVDFAAKITGNHEFWLDLVRDFGARYVVFECKNYRKAIDQGQVYSTEKYLFLPAKRSVGIFISPNGADKGALAAMKGAVRETGKLMVSLTINDVCDMLHKKDAGDEIYETLSGKIDEMLLTISR